MAVIVTYNGNALRLHGPCTAPVSLDWGCVVGVLDGGNHHPLLCHLEDSSGAAGLWVVKPYDVASMGNRREGCFNIVAELAAAEVCAITGMPTPEVGLIRFPRYPAEELYFAVPERYRTEVRTVFELNKNKLAFCCAFVEYAADVEPGVLSGVYGRNFTQQWGALLFAVDAYIRHDDRSVENPNALQLGTALIPIDHGSAFTWIDRPGMTGTALAQSTYIQSSAAFRRHIFYEPLRKHAKGIDWIEVRDKLMLLNEEAVDLCSAHWPIELEPARGSVVSFLKERKSHVVTLLEQLAKFTEEPARAA